MDCDAQNFKAATQNFLIPHACRKIFAARQRHFLNPNFVRAAFRGIAADGDCVAGLDRALCPTNPGQAIGAGEFALPFLHRSGIVLGFPINFDVRVDELESGHHTLYADCLGGIVVRRAVVRRGHAGKSQKPNAQGQKTCSSIFHVVPYHSIRDSPGILAGEHPSRFRHYS